MNKALLLFNICFLFLAQLKSSTQIETVPEEPTGFIKLLKCLPQEQMIILKKLASEILTGDEQTFIVVKDPMEWTQPIIKNFENIINSFDDDIKAKEKVVEKLVLMASFLLNQLKEKGSFILQ